MLQCPISLHRIKKFTKNNCLYVADINATEVIEIDELTGEILDLCTSLDTEKIIQKLSAAHGEEKVILALEELENIRTYGLFFDERQPDHQSLLPKDEKLKIFVLATKSIFDSANLASGASVASMHIINALKEYANIYVVSDKEEQVDDGIYGTLFDYTELVRSPLKFNNKHYDGIFSWELIDPRIAYLFSYTNIPVISRLYSPRGSGGYLINGILFLYAMMRNYDALICPTTSTKTFYSRFVHDTDKFHVIPNGVDSEHFKPIKKETAKQQVSEMLNDKQIRERPVVGFLSRFQPEKGAEIYLQVAAMNPDITFLAVAPTIYHYSSRMLPSNFIYAGKQVREKLPLFFNAFDIFCFPSVVGQESFGNVVLEAMACGVPPIVPNLAGLPEVVDECGIIVEAEPFEEEIGSFAGWVSPDKISKAINTLISNETKRIELGRKARARSLFFTWDKTANRIAQLYRRLNAIRNNSWNPGFTSIFASYISPNAQGLKYSSLLLNLTKGGESPLLFPAYRQSIEEGLAISLLSHHRFGEMEAVLKHLDLKKENLDSTLKKIEGFANCTFVSESLKEEEEGFNVGISEASS